MAVWLLGLPVIVVAAVLRRLAARHGHSGGYLMAAVSVVVLAAAVVLLVGAVGPAGAAVGAGVAKAGAVGSVAAKAAAAKAAAAGAGSSSSAALIGVAIAVAGSTIGSGTDVVEVAPLDELLADHPPTYIKMDVEGAERDALLGGAKTISKNAPVLAICLYHRPEDVWDLPLLIRSLRPDYRLYVRRHSDERWETVCYAVPPGRGMSSVIGSSGQVQANSAAALTDGV